MTLRFVKVRNYFAISISYFQMDVANGGGLQLTNFAISHVGHIDIDVSGLGPLDWILELLVDFVDTFLKVPRTKKFWN